MSVTFSVAVSRPPDSAQVLAGLGLSDVLPDAGEEHPKSGPWPEGVWHFYRPGLSARGAEISYEKGVFGARINTLASLADYDLALRFVECVAGLTGNRIEPEGDDLVSTDRLRAIYDADWARVQNLAGLASIRGMIRDEDYEVATLGGSVRPYHIGPRLLAQLEADGPAEELVDRLVNDICRVQNVDAEEYFCAEEMSAKKSGGEKFTFTAFGPDVKYLLPSVDRLAVLGEGDDPDLILVPYDKLPELIPADRWDWLDERQVLVEPIPIHEWPEVRRRARSFAIEIVPHERKPRRRDTNRDPDRGGDKPRNQRGC